MFLIKLFLFDLFDALTFKQELLNLFCSKIANIFSFRTWLKNCFYLVSDKYLFSPFFKYSCSNNVLTKQMKPIENTDIIYSNNTLLLTLHNLPCASWKFTSIKASTNTKRECSNLTLTSPQLVLFFSNSSFVPNY